MLVLNGVSVDIIEKSVEQFKQFLIDTEHSAKHLIVDWTQSTLNPSEIIDQYLPIVQYAHSVGYSVELRIPVLLISQFAYRDQPIVFCGHTLNPFAFEKVNVILE